MTDEVISPLRRRMIEDMTNADGLFGRPSQWHKFKGCNSAIVSAPVAGFLGEEVFSCL